NGRRGNQRRSTRCRWGGVFWRRQRRRWSASERCRATRTGKAQRRRVNGKPTSTATTSPWCPQQKAGPLGGWDGVALPAVAVGVLAPVLTDGVVAGPEDRALRQPVLQEPAGPEPDPPPVRPASAAEEAAAAGGVAGGRAAPGCVGGGRW